MSRKKTAPAAEAVPKRPKFEIKAVQFVEVRVPGGGSYMPHGGGYSDAVHTFTQVEAFELSNAVREAAQKL